MHKLKKHNKYLTLLVLIVFVSFVFNIIMYLNNSRYEHRVGMNSYKNIVSIKVSNDKIYNILNKATEIKKISNEEVLLLYKNYGALSECLIELWDDYNYYSSNYSGVFSKKKIDTSSILQNEVYSRIENYLENSLSNIMNTEENELKLSGKELQDFQVMKSLSEKTKMFYHEFNDKNLSGLDGKEKEEKAVKDKCWIDMLNKINQINENYTDYDFTKEVVKTKIIN
ncbi:hypothetical protein [Clostridium sp.]|uniref:hypothetical protein n=1 Tax=Clostridium sp. TaxID=1506 RepID=UPI0026DBAA2B|nr:hypothetical protein [Clostridium sp.]MDO5039358.1 hypothetical protein [Clostridium sp.]